MEERCGRWERRSEYTLRRRDYWPATTNSRRKNDFYDAQISASATLVTPRMYGSSGCLAGWLAGCGMDEYRKREGSLDSKSKRRTQGLSRKWPNLAREAVPV